MNSWPGRRRNADPLSVRVKDAGVARSSVPLLREQYPPASGTSKVSHDGWASPRPGIVVTATSQPARY